MLKFRLISGSALVALITTSVFWDHPAAAWVFVVFGCICVTVALAEFLAMTAVAGFPGYRILTVLAGLLYVLATAGGAAGCSPDSLTTLIPGIFIIAVFLAAFREADLRLGLMNAVVSLGGFLYLCWTLSFLVRIYFFAPDTRAGPVLALFLILVTKFNDIGGYTVGNITGRLLPGGNHKVTPRLSPKKSWEGLFGSVLFSIGIACALLHWWGDAMTYDGHPLLTLPVAIVIGFVCAILGFWGDLAESVVKRGTGVKDSGAIIPGMGGLLDVLDSLVFVAPLFYWYLLVVSGG